MIRFVRVAVIVQFLVYNKVTMVAFSVFNVYPLPVDGERFLAADLTVQV